MNITVQEFTKLVNNPDILVHKFRKHGKASEEYVDVTFNQKDGSSWSCSVPYFYRRTGLFIESPQELAQYLNDIFPLFEKKNIDAFILSEKEHWKKEMSGKETTKEFFDKLLNLRWNSVKYDLPKNPNWARRVQDIKEFGYTLATDTNRKVLGKNETDTHILLVPIPRGSITGYEVMSPEFKKRAIKILSGVNIYELSSANKNGLIPDHKFPEIRWDAETKAENPDDMEAAEIIEKFQLLDNQRNQQKREVCRNCFQTGKRGIVYGLNYFYHGTENWPADVPRTGKDAEKGCIGCGWYDLAKWREALNKKLK